VNTKTTEIKRHADPFPPEYPFWLSTEIPSYFVDGLDHPFGTLQNNKVIDRDSSEDRFDKNGMTRRVKQGRLPTREMVNNLINHRE
jgi:hypothetical protein